MNSSTKTGFALILAPILLATATVGPAIQDILRHQIVLGGFTRAQNLYQNPDPELIAVGGRLFQSPKLSINGNVSCRTCHLDQFGSSDGIPNAAAIGGMGVGPQRALSGAKMLARKTLPLWGRGGKNFNAFFWDGKVSLSDGRIVSQFGSNAPSKDLLVTAAHLPVVEIREMVSDDAFVDANKQESVANAQRMYRAVARNLIVGEPQASQHLAKLLGKKTNELGYTDFARALAAFIRSKFRIKKTELERFVFEGQPLSESQLRGALLFYGSGSCITCHAGPYFSDFKFHVVAFPQLGFGKNGFGVDYGRYNATFDPRDLYKFRTPPLFNIEKTGPYSHSGSVDTLQKAIIAHFDPLSLVDLTQMTGPQRNEFYKRLTLSQETANRVGYLTPDDVNDLVAFLKTLSF